MLERGPLESNLLSNVYPTVRHTLKQVDNFYGAGGGSAVDSKTAKYVGSAIN